MEIIPSTDDGVMRKLLNRASVLREKSGMGTPVESSVELYENFRARHSALLVEEVKTSNWLNKGGIEGFLLFRTLLRSRQ